MRVSPRPVGALAGAVAALAVGGVGLAMAQEAPITVPSPPGLEIPTPSGSIAPAPAPGVPGPEDGAGRLGWGTRAEKDCPRERGIDARPTVVDQTAV